MRHALSLLVKLRIAHLNTRSHRSEKARHPSVNRFVKHMQSSSMPLLHAWPHLCADKHAESLLMACLFRKESSAVQMRLAICKGLTEE